jgi:GNAT superfamily N-acetyltransferase
MIPTAPPPPSRAAARGSAPPPPTPPPPLRAAARGSVPAPRCSPSFNHYDGAPGSPPLPSSLPNHGCFGANFPDSRQARAARAAAAVADAPRRDRLDVVIRECCGRDEAAVVAIAAEVRDDGIAWWWPLSMTESALHNYWFGFEKDTLATHGRQIYVACLANDPKTVCGAFLLEPNKPGNCSHVAHGAYMVKREYRRRGVARKMGEYSLEKAKAMRYRAMQFNMVVSANLPAIKLWQSLAFEIVGTLPGAFSLPSGEYCDGFVMFRNL